MFDPALSSLRPRPFEAFPELLTQPFCETNAKIFDVAADGVIVAVKLVSAKFVVELLAEVPVVPITTCKTLPPPAGAAHANPVAVALSATILAIGIVQVLA